MAQYEDLIAKLILQVLLEPRGNVQAELEVPVLDAQGGDLYFEPTEGAVVPDGVFGKMTAARCVLEPFSRTPSREVLLRGCLRKQLQLFHNFCLEAERRDKAPPPLQQMWIITPGKPEAALAAFGCRPLDGFPAGFYTLPPGFAVSLVVLAELPLTVDTIPLRLLGTTPMRQDALRAIKALPASDPGREELRSTIAKARFMIEKDPKLPREDKEEFMNAIHAEFEQFKQGIYEQGVKQGLKQGVNQGLNKGIEQGQGQSILAVLEDRGIAVSEDERERVLSCADRGLLRRWLSRSLHVTRAADLFLP